MLDVVLIEPGAARSRHRPEGARRAPASTLRLDRRAGGRPGERAGQLRAAGHAGCHEVPTLSAPRRAFRSACSAPGRSGGPPRGCWSIRAPERRRAAPARRARRCRAARRQARSARRRRDRRRARLPARRPAQARSSGRRPRRRSRPAASWSAATPAPRRSSELWLDWRGLRRARRPRSACRAWRPGRWRPTAPAPSYGLRLPGLDDRARRGATCAAPRAAWKRSRSGADRQACGALRLPPLDHWPAGAPAARGARHAVPARRDRLDRAAARRRTCPLWCIAADRGGAALARQLALVNGRAAGPLGAGRACCWSPPA